MGSITLLLGRSRWRRRKAIPSLALSGVDALGRPDFLFVAASAAKRQAVERDFLAQRGERYSFAPEVRVWSELVEDLWHRHGSGNAVLPRAAAEAIAESVTAEYFPNMETLGSPRAVGASLLRLRDVLDRGFRLPRDRRPKFETPIAPTVHLALDALEQRLHAVPGFLPSTSAMHALREQLQFPSASLMASLRRFRTVIFDDMLQPSPLERALLIDLARAWEAAGVHVVIGLETGMDLGGREVGILFRYDDADDVAYPLRPFQATRSLRESLFEELVASGEARLILTSAQSAVEIDPATEFTAPGTLDLSDHLSGPRPIRLHGAPLASILGDTIRLHQAPTEVDEWWSIAEQVHEAIERGASPDSCVVAVPGLRERWPLIEAAFADHGLSVMPSRPPDLGTTALGGFLSAILDWLTEGPSVARAAAVVTSGWAQLRDLGKNNGEPASSEAPVNRWTSARGEQEVRRALKLLMDAGITHGGPTSWEAPLTRWATAHRHLSTDELASAREVFQVVADTLSPLMRLVRPRKTADWLIDLLDVLEAIGCASAAESDPNAAPQWSTLVEAVHEAARIRALVNDEEVDLETQVQRLRRIIEGCPAPLGGARTGHIRILELDDVTGLTPRFMWIAGLNQGVWPRMSPPSFLVSERALREVEAPRPAVSARYLFASLIRNALDDARIERLVLSWPAVVGNRVATPSPLVHELLQLPTDASGPSGRAHTVGELVSPSPRSEKVRGTRALRVAQAHGGVSPEPLTAQRAAQEARRATVPGVYEGILARPPADLRRSISVTKLETFMKCPAQYWYEYTLGLGKPDAQDPQVPATDRGRILHAILERFYEVRLGRPLDGDLEILAKHLHKVAEEALDELSAAEGPAAPLVDALREDWLAGLIDGEPAGMLRAWLMREWEYRSSTYPIALERSASLQLGGMELRAKLDRVDHTTAGAIVLDYKSGEAPSNAKVESGLALQSIAYTLMQREREPDRPVAAAYVSLKNAPTVKPSAGAGSKAVLSDLGLKPRSMPFTESDLPALRDYTERAAERLQAGVAHTTMATQNLAGCEYCEYRRICRFESHRNATIAESEVDLQRPLNLPTEEEK